MTVLLSVGLLVRYIVGAPVQIAQIKDDPDLAKDPQRNNDFQFDQVCLKPSYSYFLYIYRANTLAHLSYIV